MSELLPTKEERMQEARNLAATLPETAEEIYLLLGDGWSATEIVLAPGSNEK